MSSLAYLVGLTLFCGATTAEPQAAVAILLDGSSSMGAPRTSDGTPFEQAVAAASLFIAGCDPSIAPGVVIFDSSFQILTRRLEPASPERRRAILDSLRQPQPNGTTDILMATAVALRLLDASKAPTKWIILLSDGGQTQPIPADLLRDGQSNITTSEAVQAAGKVIAAQAKSKGVRILAVGLGADADRRLLQTLASETEGAYVAVSDASQLLQTYADWLRTVGGYVVHNGEKVHVADGDTDLKVLMALPVGCKPVVERDGKVLSTEAAGFQPWTDGRRLHVWQAAHPLSGSYRLSFDPQRAPSDHLICLKRTLERCDVQLKYYPGNPQVPLQVVVRGIPAGQTPDALIVVANTQGKEIERPLSLRPGRDGTLITEFPLDPGTHNIRIRLRDRSGWETQHFQTVSLTAAPPLKLPVTVHSADVPLSRGQRGQLVCELQLGSGEVPAGEVEAELSWVPTAKSAPRLKLDGGGRGTSWRVPLRAKTVFPFQVEVPTDGAIGQHEGCLFLRVIADRPVLLNGLPRLTVPLSINVQPAQVRLQLLDAARKPLTANVLTHRVLSPVADRTEELHFHLRSAPDTAEWQVRHTKAEVGGVHCAIERPGAPGQILVRLTIPRQSPPGVRSFNFKIEPGDGIRLTDDSCRHFQVDLVIPEATIALSGLSGAP